MPNKKIWIIIATTLSLLLHLLLATLPGFKVDVDSWFGWSIQLSQHPLNTFYASSSWNEYTPGFLYVLAIFGHLKSLLNISPQLFYFLLKLPAILSEVFLGAFVYKLFEKKSLVSAKIGSLLIFFNPAFLFDSSIWGQIESILTLFLLLSIYYLDKQKYVLSGIFWGLAFLIKPQAIALLPLFPLFIIKKFSIPNSLKIFFASSITVFSLSLPFFGSSVLSSLPKLIFAMSDYYHYTSLFAFNLWGVFGFWINDSNKWFYLSYSNWGYLLFSISILFTGYLYVKKGLTPFGVAALCFLSFYFLPTRVHDRYLYPGLFFLLLHSLESKNYALKYLYIFLSLTFLSNFYFVYTYYNSNFYHLSNPLYSKSFFMLLQSNLSNISLISTLLFISIFTLISKTSYEKN